MGVSPRLALHPQAPTLRRMGVSPRLALPPQALSDSLPPVCPLACLQACSPAANANGNVFRQFLLAEGAWCSGIASASHADGPGFKSQCVHSTYVLPAELEPTTIALTAG